MILYHTGLKAIEHPDIRYGRTNADFGQGFYTTSDYEFSNRWAKDSGDISPIINTYELCTDGLTIHRFQRDRRWFSYIFNNRRSLPDSIAADIIIGPIANDTIYDAMGMITSGYLSNAQALQLLLLGPEYHQIVLKTEKAASQLIWKSSAPITKDLIAKYRKLIASEQDQYLRDLAAAMDSF